MRFDELYMVMQRPCEAMTLRLTLNPSVASQLYDEVMARTYARWSTLRLRKVPHRFVARSVLGKSINFTLSGRLAEMAQPRNPGTSGLSESDAETLNDRRAVAAGLKRLRRPVRESVAYMNLAGFGVADTAQLAGIDDTEAQRLATRGLADLRGWLTTEQFDVLVA